MRLGGRLTLPAPPLEPAPGKGRAARGSAGSRPMSTDRAEPANPAGDCQRQSAHLQVLCGVRGPVLVFAVWNTVVNDDRFRIC